MTPSRVVRSLLLFLLLAALPTFAFAATTEFRVLFDTDADSTTGCKVGAFEGVEQVLVTQVVNDDTTPQVNRTYRQLCVAGALGAPTGEVTTGWPSVWRSGDRLMTLETRIPFSAFGSGMPESLHVGFDVTRNAASQQALVNIDGSPVFIPAAPRRRHAVGDSSDRMITLDGVLLDWGAIKPIISGIASDGSQALRLLRVYSFSNPVDSYIYFAAQTRISSETPFADDDLYEREPGQGLNVAAAAGVLKNDGDPHGLPLTATKVSEPLRGTVTLNPDGSFTYSPNNAASQLGDEFEYKATTGTADSNVARVLIKINNGENPNGPPVDDAYETKEDKTLVVDAPGVLENDPGSQNLVASLKTPPSHGTVTLNADGGFTYKPTINFFGTDTFVYTATRTTSGHVVGDATVTIEVSRVNDPPSFTPGGNITRPANAGPYSAIWATNIVPGPSNENGQIVTFVVTNNNNALFTVQPAISSNGTLTFTPAGTLGSATVTVFAQDNGGTANGGDNTSDPVTFTITITCGNIVVTSPANNTATVGTPFSATFTQSGAVGTATFTTASTLPAGLSLSTTGVLSGTPTQQGSFPITVTVTDSNGCSGSSSGYVLTVNCQTITVTNPATNTGTAGSPFSQTFTQSGALGGATFTTSSTLPAGLSLSTSGVLSGTPTQTGTFPIVVTVTDGNGCTGTGPTYNLVIGCQSITVTNPGASTATANSPFSATFTQSGGIGTTTFSLASGTLPAGLTLAANGTLSGTPTQTGSFPITVTATDSNGCTGTGATYTLTVGCQTITVNNPATTTGTASAPFSQTFTATNTIGTTTFTLASGSLPAGLTLAANGTLSGTPTQTGSFPITVTATDANGCAATGPVYNLVINCQTITVTNPTNTTGTVSSPFSEQFTQTGAIGTATFTTASTLPAGLTLSTSGLLSGTPTQPGTFPITVTVTDSNGCTGTSATYTLIINCQTITVTNPVNATGPAGSPFSETFTQAGAVGTATFTLASGTLPTGLTLAPTGVLSGTPTQGGTFPITVTVTDSNGCTGTGPTYNLTITCPVITVNNPANSTGTAGTAFSETFTQSGGQGTITWSFTGTLPSGISLNPATGVLSGTTNAAGSFPITVIATDQNGCTGNSGTYTLVINCQTITVTNPANSTGTVDAAFSEQFTQTGVLGTVTWSIQSGTLPAGLSLAGATGILSGTPTEDGTFNVTVRATDTNGCFDDSAYSITINCQTITVTNPGNNTGTVDAPFSEQFTQTGAHGTPTFTTASTLPAGLSLDSSTGILSGTPTEDGVFNIVVDVADVNGCPGSGATYTLTINCQTITVTNPVNTVGTVGSPFSETFTQTGAHGTATFATSSTLPQGLSLSAGGVLSGTPDEFGTFNIVVTVSDANSCPGTGATYTLTINCQTITVTPPANANGTAGSPFSETFTQTGGIGPITWSLASGSLPAGLTLNPSTGVVSGTPTVIGSFPITVTATDSNGCTGTSTTYTIVIGCQTITVINPSNDTGPAGSPFSETFTQTGAIGTATFTLASGTLPTGLTLAPNGVLAGTPTQGGTFPITVTVTDSNGCTGTGPTYNLTITCPVITVNNPANANGTANSPFSETFTSTGGVGTMTYTLASGSLPAGLTLAANGVLSGTPTVVGNFPITVTATDSNGCTGTGSTYTIVIGCQTISVTNPGTTTGTANSPFSQTFTQSGGIGTTTFSLASGVLPAGLTLGSNGTLSGTPTQVGNFPITVTATDSNGCTGTGATYNLVINCQTITVTNPANANGTINVAFSETFSQSGAIGSATFTLASGSLPAGLTLASNGVVSGTPTVTGSFPITVTVTDANGCTGTSTTYTIVIACQTITVTNPANSNGTVGSVFTETFTQTGANGTVTWSLAAGSLPAGMTLDPSTGVISGTPTQSGNFPIAVKATDVNGCFGTSSTYTIVIACQTITVNNPATTTGTVDAPFSQTFTQTGGIGTTTFSTSSTLPAGLTLASNGTLSGTPGAPGTFNIVVVATDSNGCTGTGSTYTLVIGCQTITVTNPGVTTGTVDAAFSQTFTQTGVGTHTPVVWSIASGTLPSGLTLNTSTGVLSGTPGQPGSFPITVKATDANGCFGTSATYNLVIACQTITVTNPGVNTATYNVAFSQTFTQSGVGTHTPVVWSVTGTLPTGITLNSSTGVLSGTPTQTGTYPITVTATDANGCAGTGTTYTLSVAPKANDDSFSNAVANTQFVLTGGTTATPATPSIQIAGTIETNDLPSAATVTVTAGTFATANGGSVVIAADGTFLYTPPAQSGVAFTAVDTFTYTVSSNTGGVAAVTSAPATVTINLANRVWYVRNNAAAGGDGRSHLPFNTLASAQTASTVNDIIFIYTGDGTSTNQTNGFVLKNGQKLYGQGIALVVNSQTLVAAGAKPLIRMNNGAAVSATNLTGNEVKGLSISTIGSSGDAILAVTNAANSGGIEISDNTITGAKGQGINIDAGGSGTFTISIHDNSITSDGNGIDIARTAGTVYITAFDDLTVTGATTGAGIVVTGPSVNFDANGATAGVVQVDANNVAVGSSGDPVTGAGMTLSSVSGDLYFDDLDVFGGTTGLFVSGSGTMSFSVLPASPAGVGTSTISAANGAAVDITGVALDLRMADMDSTTAAGGVNLSTVTGQFRAPAGSTVVKASGAGTAFVVTGSNVTMSYEGTLNVTAGGGVSLTTDTGSTMSFLGGMTLSTGANAGFVATGGGLVNVVDPAGATNNTITTTTGNGLTITTPTNIGGSGVTFERITVNNGASNSAVNGIVLSGTTGTFIVTGDGSQTGGFYDRDGSGGTISRTTGHSVLLSNASNVTLRQMNITNVATNFDGVNSTTGSNIVLSAMNFDTLGRHGWLATDIGGVNRVDNNSRFFTWNTNNANAVQVSNATDSGFTSFTIDKSLFTTSSLGADGFLFDGNGNTAGTVTVTNSEFTLIDQDAVQINNDSSGLITAVVQGNNFHDADNTSGDGNNTLFMAASNTGTLDFTIGGAGALANTFTNLGRLGCACGVVQVNAASTGVNGTRIVGIVQGNTISNTTGRRGIDFAMEPNGGSHGGHDITVTGNTISNTQNQGINVTMTSLSGGDQTGNKIEITNNNLSAVGLAGAVDSGSGIEIETNDGASGATFGNDILIQGNTVQNNNASAVGSTLEVVNRGTNSGSSSTMNLTVWGNTLTNNTVGSGEVFEVLSSGASGTVTTCLDMNGANLVANRNTYSGGAGGFRITNNYIGAGAFNIGGMAAGAQTAANVQTFVSARNNSLTVTAGGVVGTFAGSPGGCTLP